MGLQRRAVRPQVSTVKGAITAAVHEKATFSLTFADGTTKDVSLGEHASCYKGAVMLPGRKHPVRHLVAVPQELHTNGSSGRTLLLRYRREEAWATLVSFLGLPADPTWAEHILGVVEQNKRIEEIDGIGCEPVLVSQTYLKVGRTGKREIAWRGMYPNEYPISDRIRSLRTNSHQPCHLAPLALGEPRAKILEIRIIGSLRRRGPS